MELKQERFSLLLFHVCLGGCILGALGTLYFLVGLAATVRTSWLNLFVAVSLATAMVLFLCALFRILREGKRLDWLLGSTITGVILCEVFLSLVPPVARDELTHHLAIPKLYAKAGHIIEVPIAPYAYYPMLLDMLYTPWIYWGYDSVPKVVHALFGYLTGLSLCAYLSRRMSLTYGLFGFLMFISVPSVLRLSHWGYVDLGITFYTTGALLCLLRWREEKNRQGWFILAALSAGFAIATKPNGLVACLLLAFMVVWILVEGTNKHDGKLLLQFIMFCAIAALPVVPWFGKNWFQTGNPFFPLLGGFFPAGQAGGGEGPVGFGTLGIFAQRKLLYGESWWQIAALPLRIFFSGRDDDPQYFDGVLNPILILFLPWAFKGKWLEEKKFLFAFAAIYFLYGLFLVNLRVRYILLIVPPLVILAVYGVFNVFLRIKRPIYLFATLLFLLGVNGYYLGRYFGEVAPLGLLTGAENREGYLSRMLPEYPAFDYVNRHLPPQAKIYLLFIGRRAYYCERDYYHDGGELPGLLVGMIRSAQSASDLGRQFSERRLTHLLLREELLIRFLRNNLTPAQMSLWDAFASQHLVKLFQHAGYSVWRVHG